ncbi:MAG TPA: Shedu anti-phage system protein SduA domain-containing protein [Candidatus Angelobacter sp.]
MPLETNILGLADDVFSFIYPLNLSGLGMGVAIFEPTPKTKTTLLFRNTETLDQFEIIFEMTITGIPEGAPEPSFQGQGWMKFFANVPDKTMALRPGQYKVYVKTVIGEEFLGYLNFHHAEPPALTGATIEAIKADPMARKFVRYSMLCNKCQNQFRCYSGVERSRESEAQGWIWQPEIPDIFTCTCGALKIQLQYIKKGLHGLLNRSIATVDNMTTISALYSRSALEEYCRQFQSLLNSRPKNEEILQKFLDEHKVFLHRFAAQQIRSKPPILSKFNADFVILNNRKELLLIEIERSTVKLLKKSKNAFGVTAELQHAIDQVRSWRQVFDDYRDAALGNIDIDKKDVAKIRGVVIAGRTPENAAEARYLRSLDLGVDLFTYDDLISDVVESIRHIAAT